MRRRAAHVEPLVERVDTGGDSSHRIPSKAAFACLAGAAPIPAGSVTPGSIV
jgi:hypothetical protein